MNFRRTVNQDVQVAIIKIQEKNREGRLQRIPRNDQYISSFQQVLLRHGITMTAIAIVLMLSSSATLTLISNIEDFIKRPGVYAVASALIIVFFVLFLSFRKPPIGCSQSLWMVYLFGISVVEEIAFRLAMPLILSGMTTSLLAILISNCLFAGLHYFTLRWKLIPCIFTFLGGLGFARLLETSGNLVLVILVHWVVTFLNTPVPPNQRVSQL